MKKSIPCAVILILLVAAAIVTVAPGDALADTYTFTGLGGGTPLSIASNGTSVFVGMQNGRVWRNTGGTSWVDTGNLSGAVNALVYDGATIYAGTSHGEVFHYIADGTWGWSGYGAGWGNSVTCMVATGAPGSLYVGSSNRHVYWKNGLASWLDTATDMGSTVMSLTSSSSYVYASTINGIVYRYNNNPSSPAWINMNYCRTIDAHIVWNDNIGLRALGYNSHVWEYNGADWLDGGSVGFYPITAFVNGGASTLYAGNSFGQVWATYNGANWTNTSAGFAGGTAIRGFALSGGGPLRRVSQRPRREIQRGRMDRYLAHGTGAGERLAFVGRHNLRRVRERAGVPGRMDPVRQQHRLVRTFHGNERHADVCRREHASLLLRLGQLG